MSLELYTGTQCRELDRMAIAGLGITGFLLMQRAGQAMLAAIMDRWPSCSRLIVVCGKGNNAGDGYIVAGSAVELGLSVRVLQVLQVDKKIEDTLSGDAAAARDWAAQRGVVAEAFAGDLGRSEGCVLVDALLGTGFRGELLPAYADAAGAINTSGLKVAACDLPTGVSADTGAAAIGAVHADLTVTFIGHKIGLFTGAGVEHAGVVKFADLGVGDNIRAQIRGVPRITHPACALPGRRASDYKHRRGHLVVVGGHRHMGGAVILAADAALRVGAGLVTVVCADSHSGPLLARRPEVMVVSVDDQVAVQAAFARASHFVVGPGLGRDVWARDLFGRVLSQGKPVLVDADGLYWLAADNLADGGAGRIPAVTHSATMIVTPHAAEAANLLGISVAEVHADRPGVAKMISERYQAAVVLKGAGSVLCSGDPLLPFAICGQGNAALATAGSGDVLAGIIGGLWAQGLGAAEALTFGACVHGAAADQLVARRGVYGLVAGELSPVVVDLMNQPADVPGSEF